MVISYSCLSVCGLLRRQATHLISLGHRHWWRLGWAPSQVVIPVVVVVVVAFSVESLVVE